MFLCTHRLGQAFRLGGGGSILNVLTALLISPRSYYMPGFGSLAFSWWVPVLYVIVLGHITNLCVTLYLHRSATHEGVKFAAPVEMFMRFRLWLTTGITTVQWVACHR